MGALCCCCVPERLAVPVRDDPGASEGVAAFPTNLDAMRTQLDEAPESLRTNPRVESFSQYLDAPQRESFQTLVPERTSFGTLVPERQSFNTIVPDRQSFRTLVGVDSFDASSARGSYRTLVPDKRSFQTLPGTGSRPASRCASFDVAPPDRLPGAGVAARTPELYKDSMEATATPQTRLLDGRAAGYGKGRLSSSPYNGR
eukprot:SRR837773.1864.p1 GENE.SRR837773.1864~~SRR837773.1864.p1  ORF type:complete len:214 (-),score=6.19 SRR837773.1864:148-750(-)